jgi:hypothetical protein
VSGSCRTRGFGIVIIGLAAMKSSFVVAGTMT